MKTIEAGGEGLSQPCVDRSMRNLPGAQGHLGCALWWPVCLLLPQESPTCKRIGQTQLEVKLSSQGGGG